MDSLLLAGTFSQALKKKKAAAGKKGAPSDAVKAAAAEVTIGLEGMVKGAMVVVEICHSIWMLGKKIAQQIARHFRNIMFFISPALGTDFWGVHLLSENHS